MASNPCIRLVDSSPALPSQLGKVNGGNIISIMHKKELSISETYTNSMKEEDKAWLACAIDGEGGLYYREISPVNRVYDLYIYNTNREFVEKACKLMNGRIHIFREKPPRKTKYVARVQRKEEILRILEEVLPYLIIKKKIAEEAIKWIRDNPKKSPREAAIIAWNNLSEEKKKEKIELLKQGHKKYWEKMKAKKRR